MYRLQEWREDAAGWKKLHDYPKLDSALEAGRSRKSGHVRVLRVREDKSSMVVIAWRNGRVLKELEAT